MNIKLSKTIKDAKFIHKLETKKEKTQYIKKYKFF